MACSEFTKCCRRRLWFFRILDWVCLSLPLLVYLSMALADDGIKVGLNLVQKVLLANFVITISQYSVSNHHVVHFKLTQCYMSVISQSW